MLMTEKHHKKCFKYCSDGTKLHTKIQVWCTKFSYQIEIDTKSELVVQFFYVSVIVDGISLTPCTHFCVVFNVVLLNNILLPSLNILDIINKKCHI